MNIRATCISCVVGDSQRPTGWPAWTAPGLLASWRPTTQTRVRRIVQDDASADDSNERQVYGRPKWNCQLSLSLNAIFSDSRKPPISKTNATRTTAAMNVLRPHEAVPSHQATGPRPATTQPSDDLRVGHDWDLRASSPLELPTPSSAYAITRSTELMKMIVHDGKKLDYLCYSGRRCNHSPVTYRIVCIYIVVSIGPRYLSSDADLSKLASFVK